MFLYRFRRGLSKCPFHNLDHNRNRDHDLDLQRAVGEYDYESSFAQNCLEMVLFTEALLCSSCFVKLLREVPSHEGQATDPCANGAKYYSPGQRPGLMPIIYTA